MLENFAVYTFVSYSVSDSCPFTTKYERSEDNYRTSLNRYANVFFAGVAHQHQCLVYQLRELIHKVAVP
jgi:hypothetical protein